MIRVLVAEDEPPILRAVKSQIEQTNPAFSVTAMAADGAVAMELLENEDIDVVFTDIRMPVMDGLALLEYIHDNRPEIYAVVLSGYNDFEYAQKALKSRAFDYLLKPVSPEPLAKLLDRLEAAFSGRGREERKRQFSRMINRSPDEAAPEGKSDGRQYAMMTVCAGPYLYDDGDALSPGAAFWEGADMGALLAKALPGGTDHWTFRGETAADRVIVAELLAGDTSREIVNRVFESVGRACGLPITAVGCCEPVGMQDAGRAYRALRRGLLPAVRIGRSTVGWVDIHGVSPCGPEDAGGNNPTAASAAEKLGEALREGPAKTAEECLNAALKRLEDGGGSQQEIVRFLLKAQEVCLRGKVVSPEAAAAKRREMLEAVSGSVSMEMLRGNVTAVFSTLAEDEGVRKGGAAARRQPVADRIETYLQQNYRNTITNLTLSQEFGFVPSYVSRIFREHTGLSVSDYLMNLRIDCARQLIRENPGIMVKEVADMAGFKDQYHFSKTFKRLTGMWPSEYRR